MTEIQTTLKSLESTLAENERAARIALLQQNARIRRMECGCLALCVAAVASGVIFFRDSIASLFSSQS